MIAAAYSVGDQLPIGRTRIATVHVMIPAGQAPVFTAQLTAAATVGGERIAATIELVNPSEGTLR